MSVISPAIQLAPQRLWTPTFGPLLEEDGCLFRLWARPDANIDLVLEAEGDAKQRSIPMALQSNGMFEARVRGAGAGTRYWFKIDGEGPYPDPASRLQPLGVHGPSQVVGPDNFQWKAKDFQMSSLREQVLYELHVGTFTPQGTFLAVIDKLDGLRQLGIGTIELLPVAEFAGDYNWGYDGVSLYAPAHSYGPPDDLRELVDQAHQRGIAVCLDVVYNHLGPDGAYHSTFAPRFYSGKHKTPWGDGLNFDGDGREKVRDYFIESALQWVYDFRIDCLRADATHAILDDSKPNFLTELTERVHAVGQQLGRKVLIVAEDERNERKLVLPTEQGGHGFDAVWSDDFHHHMRRRLAGDSDGYFCDFDGAASSIAQTIQDGWFFSGQFSRHAKHARGTDPAGLSHESRVINLQNHDQIGNRALGDRLSSNIDRAAYMAASALLLLAPETPLIFMGQEWAADEPFLYFTNHHDELGRLVTEGRRKEFERFTAFGNAESVPDPQGRETFLRSKLDWAARTQAEHALCLHWYRRLLHLRRRLVGSAKFVSSRALNEKAVELHWQAGSSSLFAVIALEGPCEIGETSWGNMQIAFSSEDALFVAAPQSIQWEGNEAAVFFARPGALIVASGDLSI
ncbi:MAG: malto-oligosyltrehalose trehalohydrolase [Acidobacteriaceae bacterium]